MSQSDRATEYEIITAVLNRLHAKVPELNDHTCIFCDQPVPAFWPPGPLCCVVSPGGSSYPEAFYVGGGVSTLYQDSTLDVTVWLQRLLDRPTSLTEALLANQSGLIRRWKPEILRALLLEMDDSNEAYEWMPLNEDGKGLLRGMLAPRNASAIKIVDTDTPWVGLTISFGVEFDWRL